MRSIKWEGGESQILTLAHKWGRGVQYLLVYSPGDARSTRLYATIYSIGKDKYGNDILAGSVYDNYVILATMMQTKMKFLPASDGNAWSLVKTE